MSGKGVHRSLNVRYRGIIRTSILEGVTAAFDPTRTLALAQGQRPML